ERLARIDGDQAHPLAVDGSSPYGVLLADATTLPHSPHDPVALDGIGLLAPIARPGSIIAVGLNYADHARESGMDEPPTPITFPKLPQSVVGPDEVVRWTADQSTQVDYEAELA